jgi:hypothetical protein
MSGDPLSSSNTALGSVFMATQYDSTKPAFANKQQLENHQYSMSAKPTYNMIHPVECDRSQSTLSELYVTQTYPTGQSDPRMYYLGTFYIGSQGTQSSVAFTMGELWVNYTVELLKPRMLLPGPNILLTSHWSSYNVSITTSAYFGNLTGANQTTLASGSNLITTLTNTTVTLPNTDSGTFMILYTIQNSSQAACAPPQMTATTNCSFISMWYGDGTTFLVAPAGTNTSGASMTAAIFKVTGSSPLITFSGGTIPATQAMDLYITSVNSGVVTLSGARDTKDTSDIKDIIKGLKLERNKFDFALDRVSKPAK